MLLVVVELRFSNTLVVSFYYCVVFTVDGSDVWFVSVTRGV